MIACQRKSPFRPMPSRVCPSHRMMYEHDNNSTSLRYQKLTVISTRCTMSSIRRWDLVRDHGANEFGSGEQRHCSIENDAVMEDTEDLDGGRTAEHLEEGLESTKRQRRDANQPPCGGIANAEHQTDCYDEVMIGNFGESKNNGFRLFDDWLVDAPHSGSVASSIGFLELGNSSKPHGEQLKLGIHQTSQQLTRIKRLLWPAAEETANVINKTKKATASAQKEFVKARSLANPMAALGDGRTENGLNHRLFINRSAIKMANIDKQVDLFARSIWWNQPIQDGDLRDDGNESIPSLIFADLCGAPGGFSEYLIKRFESCIETGKLPPSAICRGYGMSLRGKNEHGSGLKWRMGNQRRRNVRYYVCSGSDGTGDIYNSENVASFQRQIEKDIDNTNDHTGLNLPAGVQLVVADGGFDQQRDHECQEQIAQKLVLCEMAAALEILAPGGTFVVKMFGFQTPAIRLAMKSLYERFEKRWFSLKPISSRPASSERYVVFINYVGRRDDFRDGPDWINSILMGTTLRYNRTLIGPSSLHSPQVHADFETDLDRKDLQMLTLNLKSCNAILGTLRRKTVVVESQGSDWEREWDRLDNKARLVPIELYRQFFQLEGL